MNIITPTPLVAPPPEQDLWVVRGDMLEVTLGFQNEPEIVASPGLFRLRMGFRRRQSDTLPFILTGEAFLEIEPGDEFRGAPVDIMATFEFSPAQTQTLPAIGCVYLIEWTNSLGGQNRRVLQGRVRTGD